MISGQTGKVILGYADERTKSLMAHPGYRNLTIPCE
jgi:hypothetical protein